MFVGQLTSIDGRYLSNWRTITHRSFTQHRQATKIPRWFRFIEQILLLNNDGSRIIKPQYRCASSHFKGMEVTSPPINNRAKDWIGVWNPVSSSPIYGKIVEKNAPALHITVQHWIPNPVFSTTDFPVLQLCTGCTLSL